jgi:hypothetical protein
VNDPGKQQLEEGLLATSGDMLCFCGPSETANHPAPGIPVLLKLKAHHPALYQNSTRRRVATNQDKSLYATLRSSADKSEKILAVFNFSSNAISAKVDTGAINGIGYQDLETGEKADASGGTLNFELSGYGHRIFSVDP